MDKERAVAVAGVCGPLDALELDLETGHVVLCEGDDLGAKERDDVVTDLVDGLGGKVGVVDAELVVEPGDLAGRELLRTVKQTRQSRDVIGAALLARQART